MSGALTMKNGLLIPVAVALLRCCAADCGLAGAAVGPGRRHQPRPGTVGRWQPQPAGGFLRAVVAEVTDQGNVDASRVFVTGMFNGGAGSNAFRDAAKVMAFVAVP